MNDSVFDPNTLLSQPVMGAMDTRLIPVPAGTYTAMVKNITARKFTYKKGDKEGQSGFSVDLTWAIDDAGVKEATGLDTPTVRQSLMIDLLPTGGWDLGKGKNVALGKLRAALAMNDPSAPFSFELLRNRVAKVEVVERVNDDKNSTSYGEKFADVKNVAPLT